MRYLLRICAIVEISLLLPSCVVEHNQPEIFTPPVGSSSGSSRLVNSASYGVGYNSFASISAGSSSFQHEWCKPNCGGGLLYGELEARSDESKTVNGSGSSAKFANDVISDIGRGYFSTSIEAHGTAGVTVSAADRYADDYTVESSKLQPGATVKLRESLEIQPLNIALSCRLKSNVMDQSGSLLASIIVGGIANALTVSGVCHNQKFVWFVNGNIRERGTKVTQKLSSRVGESGFLVGLFTDNAYTGKGNVILKAQTCYTLTSLTKGVKIVAISRHDYSRC